MNRLVTIFGGGGFLGRYVVEELMRAGARVRVAGRDPRGAWFLKALGGLGQSQFIAADVSKVSSVARAVAGSDSVINLVGILKGAFDAVHVQGAGNVAQAAADAGATALVQVSAIGADPASASAYGRTKGEGEAAVKAAFPKATILRPSILFGPEDKFVNRFARMIAALPVVPVVRGDVRFQPVFVADVARAVAAAALDPERYGGHVYDLAGPEVLTMMDLHRRIAHLIDRQPSLLPVPDAVAGLGARLGGWAPGAPITLDQWLMLQKDNVAGEGALGIGAFGVDPTPFDAVTANWLVRYRRHGRFGLIARTA